MMMVVLLLLLIAAVTSNIEEAAAAAIQMSVLTSFDSRNCSGEKVYSWPFAITNQCQPFTSSESSQVWSCSGYRTWKSSPDCKTSRDSPVVIKDYTKQCSRSDGSETSFKYECKTFDEVVKVTLQYTKCESAVPGAMALYLPLNTCVPAMTNSGGPNYISNTPVESYIVTKSNSNGAGLLYTVNRYYSTDCTGSVAVFQDVPSGGCVDIGRDVGTSASNVQSVEVSPVALTRTSAGVTAIAAVVPAVTTTLLAAAAMMMM